MRRLMLFLFSTMLLFNLAMAKDFNGSPILYSRLSKSFSDAELIADDIIEKFPSDHFVLVSLGRSPALISEIIRQKNRNITNLPFSSETTGKTKIKTEFFLKHFLSFLAEIEKGKTLVFIDFIITGETIAKFDHLLRKAKIKLNRQYYLVKPFFISDYEDVDDDAFYMQTVPATTHYYHLLETLDLFSSLLENESEAVAEYNAFYFQNTYVPPTKNPNYHILVNFVSQQLNKTKATPDSCPLFLTL